MKTFIKIICVLMCLTCFLSMPVCADESSTYSSAYFGGYDSFLRNPSGNTIRIWFDVLGNGKMDEIGVTSISLERSSDNQNWSTVKTFLPEDYPQMICEDTGIAYDYVTYHGTYGYYYRAYVTFYAKKGTGCGYTWEYSETLFLSAR